MEMTSHTLPQWYVIYRVGGDERFKDKKDGLYDVIWLSRNYGEEWTSLSERILHSIKPQSCY